MNGLKCQIITFVTVGTVHNDFVSFNVLFENVNSYDSEALRLSVYLREP